MQLQSKGNMEINGLGTAAGGRFDKIVINGVGSFTDAVQADGIVVNGSGSFNGVTESGEMVINGTAGVKKAACFDRLEVNGNCKLHSDSKIGDLCVAGNLKITGNLVGEKVVNEGRFSIRGNCEVETFYSQGSIKITGQLNADDIDLDIALKCEISEIGGEKIRVRRNSYFIPKIVDAVFPTYLTADNIEGDEVTLEYTRSRTVRGHHVTIGENCDIDLVEYTGTYTQSPSARVREARDVGVIACQ